jgi:DNA adenine methylase
VANFYRVLQVHYVAFLELMRFQITSRAEFERLARVDPSTLTDMQRAARFLYLQRVAFGGKVAGRNFGTATARAGAFDITRIGPMLEDLHVRLAGVVVERLPWAQFIARYDRPGTLFYLDPPYFGCEEDYGAGMFGRDEFAQMAEVLRSLKGRFVLSINDRPEVREIFAGFQIEPVKLAYSVSGQATEGRELIVTPG